MPSILNLPFMKKPDGLAKSQQSPVEPSADSELKLRLYRLIIDRYRDKIEEYEARSVSDLKGMVLPHDAKIEELRETLTSDFHPYVFSEHFVQAAKMAFAHVCTFRTLPIPVSFWLSFSDMQALLAGDEIDKSILLCSLLRSLGSEDAKVEVTDSRNSYVLFSFSGKFFLADHSLDQLQEKTSEQEARLAMKGKPLYAFNDKEYEDFAEQ